MKKVTLNITKILSILLVLALTTQTVCFSVEAKTNCTKIYQKVQETYGTSYPLSSNNEIKTKRKNIFGGYSSVLGVSCKCFSAYKAAKKSNSSYQYVSFICKASKKKNVKKIKKALKKYVKNEKNSNQNYYSADGKKLMDCYKVGSKGRYVYLFILDTTGNSKSVNAFKEITK